MSLFRRDQTVVFQSESATAKPMAGLSDALAAALMRRPEVAGTADLRDLAAAYLPITTPQSPQGQTSIVADFALSVLGKAIDAALETVKALHKQQQAIKKANTEIAADLYLKIRYFDDLVEAFADLLSAWEELPDDSEATRTLLLRVAGILESFCKAESKHGDVKKCTTWETHKSKLTKKKFYAFLCVFYHEFDALARDQTQNNERASVEIRQAKEHLVSAWLEIGPAVWKAEYRLLEAAKAVNAMGLALMHFDKKMRDA